MVSASKYGATFSKRLRALPCSPRTYMLVLRSVGGIRSPTLVQPQNMLTHLLKRSHSFLTSWFSVPLSFLFFLCKKERKAATVFCMNQLSLIPRKLRRRFMFYVFSKASEPKRMQNGLYRLQTNYKSVFSPFESHFKPF